MSVRGRQTEIVEMITELRRLAQEALVEADRLEEELARARERRRDRLRVIRGGRSRTSPG